MRVVDDDIGVGAGGDGALLRVEAEHPGRGGAGDLDPAAAGDPAFHDRLMQQVHPVLHTRHPVRDLREVAAAHLLLTGETERAVVGGDDLELVVPQAPPERLLVFLGPQRGGADVLGALEVRLGEVVGGEEEVLRARLTEDRKSLVAGGRQFGDGLVGGDMHDVQRGSGDAGELDGAVGGLGLQCHLADVAVVARVGAARGQRLLDEDVDRDAVLGMHHDQPAVAGGPLHGPQNLTVVAVEDAGVGHEQLEGGDALRDQQVHLPQRGLVHVGEDHVEGVVDRAVAVGLRVPGVEPLTDRAPHGLDGEVDDRGGAAPGGRPGPGLEGVGGVGAAERHLHVRMRVDAAGDDVLAGGVDGPVGGPALGRVRAVRGECGDAAALDEYVCMEFVGRGDDEAAVDDGAAHVPLLTVAEWVYARRQGAW